VAIVSSAHGAGFCPEAAAEIKPCRDIGGPVRYTRLAWCA
jgi:hypothetical protein